MGMRIAFVGASGTGKTTLAKAVAREFGLQLNPIGSRSVAKSMGFQNPYDVDRASLRWYLECLRLGRGHVSPEVAAMEAMSEFKPGEPTVRAHFQQNVQDAKIHWESCNESFVTDRTTIDDLVYSLMHCHDAVDQAFVDRAVGHALNGYDHVFFTPMANFFDTAGDQARRTSRVYHDTFERLAESYLFSKGNGGDVRTQVIRHRAVPPGTEVQRSFWIVAMLRRQAR